ncbi:MAG: SbcC/MukB-like Walker B domain-containing protein, partial [Mariprofundaceae bacterium]|nr:SbcC/MukB-like Walker B domain-containing protein [Mariprofundaceae bacterium]
RIYLVARRNVSLKELLDAFGEGDPRALKQLLRQDPSIIICDERFSEYQESYRRLLHMDNPNAPALLARALGLKKIDDLTELIRNLVLEPSHVRDDARKAVNEFTDLVGIHNQLSDARRRRDALAELPKVEDRLQRTEQALQQLDAQLSGLSVWFGEQCAELWQQRVARIDAELQEMQARLNLLGRQLHDANDRVEQCHADYLQAGGERIEIMRNKLKGAQEKLIEVNGRAADYQAIVVKLQLDNSLEETVFQYNQKQAEQARQQIEEEIKSVQDDFAAQAAMLGNTREQQRILQDEIRAIEARPDSNIDTRFQQLRDEMANALGLDAEKLIFIGELIDVNETEHAWQGAIERALGGLRTTLAVPESSFSLVTRWLNNRHTGLHVRVQVVHALSNKAEFKSDGFLRKLVWRKHLYRDWLKQHLARFDLHCVENTEILDHTPFSMTRQGLMHMEKGHFEKKDQQRIDDRRSWQLGFSNKNRLSLLRQDVQQLVQGEQTLNKDVDKARQRMDEVGKRDRQWEKVAEFHWQDINVPYWKSKTEQFDRDIVQLEQASGDLAVAKKRWETAKEALRQLQVSQEEQIELLGKQKSELSSADNSLQRALNLAKQGLSDELRGELQKKTGVLKDAQLDDAFKVESIHREHLTELRDIERGRKTKAGNKAIGIMSSFRSNNDWAAITADWNADLASLPDYLRHLAQLEKEGLPALVERFRERLNLHATQSLAGIGHRIDAEREEIYDRIETINRVLKRTEFKVGSFLRLGIKGDQYEHVLHFNRLLKQVMEQLTSDDHEARFASLQQVITILDKASNPATANTLESLRLLDPRHQLSFHAEEVDAVDGSIRDVLMSSSGKSGGEKESFAGTIVAASLAYVLTPDGSDRPVYSTVFLDEAFSNTAEAVSRRVLRVFNELHIHVNLITPYKNLNLARDSARSLLIAERDSRAHESRLCEVTWEEIDQRLQQQANDLDIALEPALETQE